MQCFHLVPEDAAEIGARCVLPLPRRLLLVQIRHESLLHGAVLGRSKNSATRALALRFPRDQRGS